MGWGPESSQEFDPTLQFNMDFSATSVNDLLPFDAAVNAVHRISETYPAPYTLMVSGGVDSQAMIHAWIKSGIPFSIMSVIYTGHKGEILNEADLIDFKMFSDPCVKIKYVFFNIIEFLENGLEQYVIENQCTSPQICTHMKLSELIKDGTTVFSGNFFVDGPAVNYTILGLHRYMLSKNHNLIPFFFLHDPELVGSCYSMRHAMVRTNTIEEINTYKRKCEIYKKSGFPIVPQQDKMTGFEKIKEYYDKQPDLITTRDRLEFAKYPSNRIFDLRFRYYFTRKVKYRDDIITILPNKDKHEFSN